MTLTLIFLDLDDTQYYELSWIEITCDEFHVVICDAQDQHQFTNLISIYDI